MTQRNGSWEGSGENVMGARDVAQDYCAKMERGRTWMERGHDKRLNGIVLMGK